MTRHAVAVAALLFTSLAQAQVTLVAQGSTWKFHAAGVALPATWVTPEFDDLLWSSGPAQLGYGDGDEATVIPGGPVGSRYPTSYFRRSFNVSNPSQFSALSLNVLRDDGAVVYLNGAELWRTNMPDSPAQILYSTPAVTAVSGADESLYYSTAISATSLVDGVNTIAVEVHQSGPASSDVSFDLSLSGIPSASTAQLTRGPYLQLNTPNSVIVRWRTDIPTDSRVIFGESPAVLTDTVISSTLTTEHSVLLSGLTPDSRHYYAVGSTASLVSTPNSTCFFETSPPTGSASARRFWVLGDAGTAAPAQLAVRDAYTAFAATTRRADMILMLGDNAYPTGTDMQYQSGLFSVYDAITRNTPMWSCLGNHDGASADSATNSGPYYDIFNLPRNAESGGVASGTEAYYSFDYSNIHFVVLDSYETDRSATGVMADWLRLDLAHVNARWLIAFFHHPPYSRGSHNSDAEIELLQMRQNFVPILESAGVDLVLCGHSHAYERTRFIDGHTGLSSTFSPADHIVQPGGGDPQIDAPYRKPASITPDRGTIYAVAGSAGQISGGTLDHPAMWISLNELGSLVLDVADNRLEGTFLNSGGTVRDRFVILKSCIADFNADGFADFNDYLDFVDALSTGSAAADFNRDGQLDFNDYLDFVDGFSIGCV